MDFFLFVILSKHRRNTLIMYDNTCLLAPLHIAVDLVTTHSETYMFTHRNIKTSRDFAHSVLFNC